MFNWLGTIFTIISLVIFFVAWSRTLGLRPLLKTAKEQQDWKTFRVLVFITLAYQIALIVIAIIGLERTYAWLGSIFLMLFSVDVYFAATLFQAVTLRSGRHEPTTSAKTARTEPSGDTEA